MRLVVDSGTWGLEWTLLSGDRIILKNHWYAVITIILKKMQQITKVERS